MGTRAPRGLVAQRLDHLFTAVHPEGRKPYTHAEAAGAINAAAGERLAGTTYIWQLRTGRSDNPTCKVLAGLARFFGVSPACFFDECDTARKPPVSAEAIAGLIALVEPEFDGVVLGTWTASGRCADADGLHGCRRTRGRPLRVDAR